MEMVEKSKAVKTAVGSIEKQYGKGTIMPLGDQTVTSARFIGSGSIALGQALGIGGYPRGRIIEIYGPESGGKTTLTLHAIREAQREGGVAAFIDAEHAFDINYAKAIGVDTDKLLFSQPDCGEQALEIAEMLVRCGGVDIVVVDSVAALVPKAEIDGDMGEAHMGLQARLMSQALRKLTAVVNRTDTVLVFINQLRHKIGVQFGSPETTTGGNALKFYASVRMDVRRIGTVKVGDEAVGSRTRVKVVKNKMAAPFKEAEFDLRWGKGIDEAADLIDYGCQLGVIEKSGAHMSFGGEHLGQGRERSREAILADPRLMSALRTAIMVSMEKQAHTNRAKETQN
ncbi:MAG: recombinase RecA [Polyangiaceae bacterium]|nr:recombinase RecA [Polyangiaceae bacterium]